MVFIQYIPESSLFLLKALYAQLKLELQQGRLLSMAKTPNTLSKVEEVLLTRTDKHGNLYPVMLQHDTEDLKKKKKSGKKKLVRFFVWLSTKKILKIFILLIFIKNLELKNIKIISNKNDSLIINFLSCKIKIL